MSKRAVSFADGVETRTFEKPLEPLDEYDLPEGEERAESDTEVPIAYDSCFYQFLSKFQFDDDGIPIKKAKKHTLDSDEEEEEDHKRLDIKRVEGQEDSALDFDGNTKITAFNMKEEEEEGHFDADGNFIFDKKGKDVKDEWLDNIDWGAIKRKAGEQWEKESEDTEAALPTLNDARKREIFGKLAEALAPGQNVAQALVSIKKQKGLTVAEERKLRWAAKKAGKAFEETDNQKKATELCALADELLSAGLMEAYEWPRERYDTMIQKMDNVAVDSLDMFSDIPASTSAGPSTSQADESSEDEVKWEYKECNEAEVEGPFTSAEMLQKQENGDLSTDGYARRVGSGGFNPVRRIDFDLYV
ncbi:unnamed protein product [Auanema sp. JU1783]|nr:unnamed protein product [Auanema sp. JU1783]